jgi:hypothetical protein
VFEATIRQDRSMLPCRTGNPQWVQPAGPNSLAVVGVEKDNDSFYRSMLTRLPDPLAVSSLKSSLNIAMHNLLCSQSSTHIHYDTIYIRTVTLWRFPKLPSEKQHTSTTKKRRCRNWTISHQDPNIQSPCHCNISNKAIFIQ